MSSERAGGASSLQSVHDEHQSAAPGDFRPSHQGFVPRPGRPSTGPRAQPAAQVWRLPVQQCHDYGPGRTAQSMCAGVQPVSLGHFNGI